MAHFCRWKKINTQMCSFCGNLIPILTFFFQQIFGEDFSQHILQNMGLYCLYMFFEHLGNRSTSPRQGLGATIEKLKKVGLIPGAVVSFFFLTEKCLYF